MADNIDIQITDRASAQADKIASSFNNLANASDKASPALARLKKELSSIGSLGQLSAELAKIVPALNRLDAGMTRATNAAARLTTANAKLAAANARADAALSRASAAASAAAAAESRAELAALRLAQAQGRVSSSANQASTSLRSLVTQLTAYLGVVQSISAVVSAADAYTNLNNKLQNVSDTQTQVLQLSERLFDLANKTRTPVEETATAFTRFDRALKYMGKSQEDTLRLTETINKGLIVSGATAQESASALLQLSQAFNAGKLQGDEFRSISENMPMVLDAVAKALNKPISAVKQLSTEGKITAKVMYDAFKIMESSVDAKFAKTIPTLSQSVAVLRNEWIQFIGQLDQSTGASRALSSAIITLSQNLNTVAIAAGVAGVAMITYFGPSLVAMMANATRSVITFTAALARNPIGLIAVALSSLIAYIVMAGDEIKVFGSSFLTLKDYAVGAFDTILAVAETVTDFLSSALQPVINAWGPSFSDMLSSMWEDLKVLGANTKDEINNIINFFVNAKTLIINAWNNLPTILSNVITRVSNAVLDIVQTMINGIMGAFDKLFSLANAASNKLGGGDIFNTGLKIDLSGFQKQLQPEIEATAKLSAKDWVGAWVNEVEKNAQGRAVDRMINQLASNAPSQLRGTGPDITGNGYDNGKKKKGPKSELQKVKDSIIRDITKTYQGYNLTLQAANELLAKGAINQEQYNRVILKAREEYLNTIDPLRQTNKELDQQLALVRESSATRGTSSQMQQIENKLLADGVTLTNAQTQALRNKIQALEDAKVAQSAMDDISKQGTEGLRQLALTAQGYTQALANGSITQDTFIRSMNQLGVEAANLKLSMGNGDFSDVLLSSVGNLASSFDGVMKGMADSFSQFNETFTKGFADAIGGAIAGTTSFSDALYNVAQNAIGALISSLIQLGIQWAVNAALGQTLQASSMAASVAATVPAATAMATAWGPAAALASLATFGGNSAPASAGMMATFAVGETIAAASALGGFQTGGYTGNMATNAVAGVVHGKEYVFDAAATSRIGADNLENLRKGTTSLSSVSSSSGGSSGGINIEIINNGTPQTYSAQQIDENTVRLIANDVATEVVRRDAPGVVGKDMDDPNSKTSQGLKRNINAPRKR